MTSPIPNPVLPNSVTLRPESQESNSTAKVIFAAPKDLSVSGLSIAPLLFSQFHFPEGKIGLDGCRMELRPVLCLGPGQGQENVTYFDHEGSALHNFQAPDRDKYETLTNLPQQLFNWIPWLQNDLYSIIAEVFQPESEPESDFGIQVNWCYYLQGKMRFHLEENDQETQEANSSFSGWLHLLEENPARLQPFVCSLSGNAGHQLSVDDEKTISLRDSIHRCCVTGLRLVESKLHRCHVSENWVSVDQAERCNCCEESIAPEFALNCPICLQQACRQHFEKSRCQSCSNVFEAANLLENLTPNGQQQRIDELKIRFPKVTNGKNWVSTSQSTTRIGFRSFFHEYLFVFDQDNILVNAVSKVKLIGKWKPLAGFPIPNDP